MLHKMANFLTKLKNWAAVMTTTSTVDGPLFFFQRAYLLLNFATLIEAVHRTSSQRVRAFLQRTLDREAVIRNSVGSFSVNAKNDSFTKALPSFEYAHHSWLTAGSSRNVFIDIGANIGFYSILASKRYGYTSVHAFEPNPGTYGRLRRNIELNSLTDIVQLHPLGLGDTKEKGLLNAKHVHTGGSTFAKKKMTPNTFKSVEVPVDTFDDVRARQNISPDEISFIKIDVEGFEYHVLKGMEDTLHNLKHGTCIFIEIHPSAEHAAETKQLIIEFGFSLVAQSPQKNFLYQKTK